MQFTYFRLTLEYVLSLNIFSFVFILIPHFYAISISNFVFLFGWFLFLFLFLFLRRLSPIPLVGAPFGNRHERHKFEFAAAILRRLIRGMDGWDLEMFAKYLIAQQCL